MIEYKVIVSSSPKELADRVQERLNEGWRLAGGVSVAVGVKQGFQEFWEYAQAIQREKEEMPKRGQ